jgi:DNA-binding transcriptional ArsR family regulator
MSVKPAASRQQSSKQGRQRGAPSPQQIAVLAKALGHPARIQAIETLLRRRTCIGCDIADEIGLAASTTSEHLRILKEAGLIIGEIERPRVCYSIDPAAIRPLIEFLEKIEASTPPRLPE